MNWFQFGSTSVTPTPANTATPTPANTATPVPTPTGIGGNYTLTYTIGNDWGTGANINMTIKNNNSSTINGWTLVFNFPGNQKISSGWCGAFTQSGQTVTVKNLDWNASIPAGGSISGIGFGINYSGSNAKPTSSTLNGSPCIIN